MKCGAIQKQIIILDGDDLPAEVSEHLQTCLACQKLAQSMSGMRALLALKRYETPDAGFETRSAEKIRLYLKADPRVGLRAWFDELWTPIPLLKIAAAALLVMLVIYHVNSVQMSSLSTPLTEGTQVSEVVSEPVTPLILPSLIESRLPVFGSPDPAITFVRSNIGPARVQYGPSESRPVSWEY